MTALLRVLFASLFLLAVQSCADEGDAPLDKVKVEFVVDIPADIGGRIAALPEGASLKISITDKDNASVYAHHTMPILRLGDRYITEPLELATGKYFITDFFVVHDSEVIYATPKKGSALSDLVERPLPYSFNVSKNKVSNVGMQVLSASEQSPEAFGYASFSIDIVKPLRLSVFIPSDEGYALTDAHGYILQGKDTISRHHLQAKVNNINVTGDGGTTYTLFVKKGNYDYEQTFTYESLVSELAGKPWKIYLEPVVRMEIRVTGDLSEFPFQINTEGEGSLKVIWGDGTFTSVELGEGGASNDYYLPGTYMVRLKGDLAGITSFFPFGYGTGVYTFEGVQHMTKLRSLAIAGGFLRSSLNLSANTKLEMLEFWAVAIPERFILPASHSINSLQYSNVGRTISADEIAYYIDNIYSNAVTKNIRDGFIHFGVSEEPLPPSTLQRIEELKEDYNWAIHLNH